MTSECEQRLALLWASLDDHDEHEFVQRMDALVGELPADSAVGLYERASAFDSTSWEAGSDDLALLAVSRHVTHYRRSLMNYARVNRRGGRATVTVGSA